MLARDSWITSVISSLITQQSSAAVSLSNGGWPWLVASISVRSFEYQGMLIVS